MLLKKVEVLTESQKTQIDRLLEACRQSDGAGVPYPLDDEECCHYLLWADDDALSGERLSGVFGIFPLSGDSAECIACVRPEERRRGLFSQVMLPRASDDFCDLEFVFPVRGREDGTYDETVLAVLNSIGAEYDRTEYKMELTLEGPFDADAPSPDFSVSRCRVEKISSDAVCLTDVETDPEMRGMGYGTAMILSLANELKKHGIRHIIVHVSGDNSPALSLYEKTGFRTTEILSYFIF